MAALNNVLSWLAVRHGPGNCRHTNTASLFLSTIYPKPYPASCHALQEG